jgi:hypothetical protein
MRRTAAGARQPSPADASTSQRAALPAGSAPRAWSRVRIWVKFRIRIRVRVRIGVGVRRGLRLRLSVRVRVKVRANIRVRVRARARARVRVRVRVGAAHLLEGALPHAGSLDVAEPLQRLAARPTEWAGVAASVT